MLYNISITCSGKKQEKRQSVPKVEGDQIALVPTSCKVGDASHGSHRVVAPT